MIPNASVPPRVIGCDVGKTSITVFDPSSDRTTELANTADALLAFAQGLPSDCLVVCEATGGYETALLLATADAGVPAHRADARKLKAFIRSLGRLGKTDSIDARGLTRLYGQERHAALAARLRGARGSAHPHPPAHPTGQAARRADQPDQSPSRRDCQKAPWRASQRRLPADHRHRGRHPRVDRARSRHRRSRRHHQGDPRVRIPHRRHRCRLDAGTRLHDRPASRPALPHIRTRAASATAIAGGRPEVKCALFMAARNHNPTLTTVYQRLLHNGKNPLLAITALMRKLITIINARVRDALQTPTPQLS